MDAQWRDDAAVVAASAKPARSGCSAAEGASVKKGASDKKDARAISGGNGAKGGHGKHRRRRGSSAVVGKCGAASGYRSDDSNAGADFGGCFRLFSPRRAKIAPGARKISAAGSATGVRQGSAMGVTQVRPGSNSVRPGSATGVRPGSATGVRPDSATGARPPVRGASADHFRFRRSRSTSHLDERRGAGDGTNGRTENTDGGEGWGEWGTGEEKGEAGGGWGEQGGGGGVGGGELSLFEGADGKAAAQASRQKREQQQLSFPANTSSASPRFAAAAPSSRYPPHAPHSPHPPASPSPRQAPYPRSRLTRHLVSSPRLARLLATSSPHHRTGHGQRTPGPPPSHNRRAARRAASATERDFVTFENLANLGNFESLENTEEIEDFEVLEGAGSSMYGYGYSRAAPQSNRAVRRTWSTVERGAPRAFPATSPRAFSASPPSSGGRSDSPRFTNARGSAATTLVCNTTVRHDNHLNYDEGDCDEDDGNDNDEGAVTARPVQREGAQGAEGAARGVPAKSLELC
ncbi:unnamed protein product [Closterium sp. NIES-65]|nr:unnamed protein product [Closterium sp. NIES-65]